MMRFNGNIKKNGSVQNSDEVVESSRVNMEGFIIIFIFHPWKRWCCFLLTLTLPLPFQLLKPTIFKTSTVCVFFGEMMGLNWKHLKKIFAENILHIKIFPGKASLVDKLWMVTDGELSLLRFCPFLTFRYWTDLKYLHIFHLIASAHYSLSRHSQRRLSISSHLYVNPLNMLLSRYISAFPLFLRFSDIFKFHHRFSVPANRFRCIETVTENGKFLLLILFLLKNLLDRGLDHRSTKNRKHSSGHYSKIWYVLLENSLISWNKPAVTSRRSRNSRF